MWVELFYLCQLISVPLVLGMTRVVCRFDGGFVDILQGFFFK